MSDYCSLVIVDVRGRAYTRLRFSHKFKKRYVDAHVIAPDAEQMLTPSEVERYRTDTLQFDAAPEVA